MNEIIDAIFGSIGDVISNIATGVSTGFQHLLWKGVADAEGAMTYVQANGLSDFAKFGLTFVGISLAVGLGTMLFRLIRHR